ncbi:MAG: hypothetical protein PHT91_00805 [Candidatus Nanoarchaeia archaeon]|nr:hypothetical protein [Candidatus Nanoarchaeia archaeon]
MKIFSFFIFFIFLGIAFGQQEISSIAGDFSSEDFAVSSASPSRVNYNDCNLSENELESIKGFALQYFNISSEEGANVSYNYCYSYDDYYSAYAVLSVKDNFDDIKLKSLSISLSYSTEIDYDFLMNGKADFFDYYLKNKYYSYYINQTDEEYYVIFSYNYDENYTLEMFKSDLINYFDNLSAEKYFQSDYEYPIIVFKTKTSELLNIIPDFSAHISYYGDELTFTFSGFNEGSYDLAQTALTNNCNIQNQYFYPEFNDECYGSYVDKERIYFSSSEYDDNYYIYFNVYGIKGYKAEFSVGYNGEITLAKVQEFIDNSLEQYFPEYLLEFELSDNYDSTIVRDFDFNESRFQSLNKSKDRQNTNYYNSNTYVSIIEPHITIYSSSARIYSLDSKIMPPFFSQNTIITKDNVYSSIQIKENNAELAKTGLNEMLNGIVELSEWELNMSLRQYYYYYSGIDYAARQDMDSGSGMEIDSFSPNIAGVSETKTAAFDESKFDELEAEETIFEIVLNFLKTLFIQ